VVARRGRLGTVCARRACRALLRGPSTSPLDVMAVGYNWVCTVCGATNASGTTTCASCGSDAVVSAAQIEARAKAGGTDPIRRQPLTVAQLLVAIPAFAGSALLGITSPPSAFWFVGAALLGVTFLAVVVFGLVKRRK
jgi:hypothetical protein